MNTCLLHLDRVGEERGLAVGRMIRRLYVRAAREAMSLMHEAEREVCNVLDALARLYGALLRRVILSPSSILLGESQKRGTCHRRSEMTPAICELQTNPPSFPSTPGPSSWSAALRQISETGFTSPSTRIQQMVYVPASWLGGLKKAWAKEPLVR